MELRQTIIATFTSALVIVVLLSVGGFCFLFLTVKRSNPRKRVSLCIEGEGVKRGRRKAFRTFCPNWKKTSWSWSWSWKRPGQERRWSWSWRWTRQERRERATRAPPPQRWAAEALRWRVVRAKRQRSPPLRPAWQAEAEVEGAGPTFAWEVGESEGASNSGPWNWRWSEWTEACSMQRSASHRATQRWDS
jgi:hypothetical protein